MRAQALGWHDLQTWNVVLTPDYNSAHDNHFHLDLTPGSHFLGMTLTEDQFYWFAPGGAPAYGH